MSGIPDLDQNCERCPSVLILEPWTLNLQPISLGSHIRFKIIKINPKYINKLNPFLWKLEFGAGRPEMDFPFAYWKVEIRSGGSLKGSLYQSSIWIRSGSEKSENELKYQEKTGISQTYHWFYCPLIFWGAENISQGDQGKPNLIERIFVWFVNRQSAIDNLRLTFFIWQKHDVLLECQRDSCLITKGYSSYGMRETPPVQRRTLDRGKKWNRVHYEPFFSTGSN